MSSFGKTSTSDDVHEGKDLTGTRVFVTGATSGLGKETVRAMAAKGASMMLVGRNQEALCAAVNEITATNPDSTLGTIACDLGSLASVTACGAEARERFDAIDLLINNAGVMVTPMGTPKTGLKPNSPPITLGTLP